MLWVFEHKGVRCQVAICRDAGTRPSGAEENTWESSADLQLIVANRLGQEAEANTRDGGCCVHADGDGWSVAMKRVRNNRRAEREQVNKPDHTYTRYVAADEQEAAGEE